MLSAFSQRLGFAAPAPLSSSGKGKQDEEEVEVDDDNEPPQFPLPNSIQRASSSILPPPSFNFDSPPPSGHNSDNEEDGSTFTLPQVRIEPQALAAPTTTKKRVRAKVAIEKGYSQLDWGRLQRSGADLRGGVTEIRRITPSELAQHKSKDDCWQAYGGKVYNVTPFIRYHPGGIPELMRAAGKDGTELFMKTHAWVNADLMLDGCLVGFLVRE
ncbi:cytochrome b5 [Meredithblackwellia eburnea MCA 4105]